tara:strand:+ start:2368 stop:2616 length:249 start_codon:yes stop_codon:yes gene_type:complete
MRQAIAIDEKYIYVECLAGKDCDSRLYHRHGNNGNMKDRTTGRCGHCDIDYQEIDINSNTYRGTLLKIIKTGKRKGTPIFKK